MIFRGLEIRSSVFRFNHSFLLKDQFDCEKYQIAPVDLFLKIDEIDLIKVNLLKRLTRAI